MATTERPEARSLGDRIYDALFHNYVWQSIFRSGYPNTPRNQMLVVATNVFLHLHPTRIHKTHVKITHTYCLGGLSFFIFLGLTVTGIVEGSVASAEWCETEAKLAPMLRALGAARRVSRTRQPGPAGQPVMRPSSATATTSTCTPCRSRRSTDMFTGIIEEVGRVRRATPEGGGRRLRIGPMTRGMTSPAFSTITLAIAEPSELVNEPAGVVTIVCTCAPAEPHARQAMAVNAARSPRSGMAQFAGAGVPLAL